MAHDPWPVVLLPGGVLPARPAYEALLAELGDEVDARAKELEMYTSDTVPPPGYSLETEVEGILRTAADAGFETFHLVGYSAGGASSLAFVARHGDRLRSLALLEPAWAGSTGRTPEEAAVYDRLRSTSDLPPEQVMQTFVKLQLAPSVKPPPPQPGPPPPWMASRPAAMRAFPAVLEASELDFGALRSFGRPVYFALGARSNPDLYRRIAQRLGDTFADFTLEEYAERHHFDPPHRKEPARLAAALRRLWDRAESGVR